ncbi:type IV pilin [Halovenus sp. WSH3]|uniref:Type IV pilin n=1 Tax=Halovenus carboxidivorans TaxID=2692199 RepID=A0A6B0T7N1_9EURY|nr:type IV pilin [Halovenus carboxidivorans]MXR52216.1 type IV pilin [Halovenus carboxidivorans]
MRFKARQQGGNTRRERPLETQRAVSPVIGAVLMIAITVSLAVVVAPLVFATAGEEPNSTPTVGLAFHYEEVDHQREDSFGVTPADSGTEAAGLLTIAVDSGEGIPASELEIDAAVSGGELTSSDQYSADDELESGESIRLWVERGETVRVIWRSGEDSAVLDSFTIRPGEEPLPPGVPQPENGCGYIEDQLASGSDVTVQNTVVRCDLTEENVGLIEDLTIDDGAVLGEIDVNGTVSMTDGETYLGDVVAGDALQMDSGSEINGDATAGGDITIQGGSTIDGTATGGENSSLSVTDSTIQQGATTGEDISLSDAVIGGAVETSDGSVTLGTGSAIGGSLTAENASNVDVDSGSTVSGTVTTGDGTDIDLDSTSEVGGDIVADDSSDVQVLGGSQVGGDITVDTQGSASVTGGTVDGSITTGDNSDVSVTSISYVGGTIDSGGDVTTTDSTIGVDVFLEGSFSCTNTTIGGENCTVYKQPEHHVSIDNTNSAITDGETLHVNVSVTNERFEGTEDINLSVGGALRDSQSLHLNKDETKQITLSWTSASTGEYDATVRTESGFEDSTPVSVTDGSGPFFDVTVDSYDDEVFENQTVDVAATIENVGDTADTQDIELYDYNGNLVDSYSDNNGDNNLSLSSGANESVSLSWNTTGTVPDTGDISIQSDNGTVLKEVTVLEATYEINDVTLGSSGGDLVVDIEANSNDPDAEMRIRVNRSKNNNDDDNLATRTGLTVENTAETFDVNLNKVDYVTVEIVDGEGNVRAGTTVEY